METIEIREYVRPLVKWWWLLILSLLVAATASAIYTYQQPHLYRSNTTLMVGSAVFSPNPSANELHLANQLALAHAEMARRASVRQATQEALGLTWLPDYSVWVVPNTQLIEMSVTDTDPQRALLVVQELVRQMIGETPTGLAEEQRESFIERQLDDLERSIELTTEEKARLEQELLDMFSARQIADTRSQIAALDTKIAGHQSNYAALLSSSQRSATNKLLVIEPAYLPTRPLSRNLTMNVLLAAMFGLVLAAAGAYIIEYADDSIKTEQDVRSQLKLPTLAEVPKLWNNKVSEDERLISMESSSVATDAYSELRARLNVALPDLSSRCILISGPGAAAGKSLTAANLATVFALAGQRVLLVDADLRSPSLHRTFRLDNRGGLSTFLMEMENDLDSLLRPTSVKGLSVLTSGPLPLNPTILLSSNRMQDLFALLEARGEVVILDSPPVTAAADASVLATQTDGVLLVVSAQKTRGNLAKRATEILNQAHATILGVVLNEVASKDYRYGMLAYGYQLSAIKDEAEQPRRETSVTSFFGKSKFPARHMHTQATHHRRRGPDRPLDTPSPRNGSTPSPTRDA